MPLPSGSLLPSSSRLPGGVTIVPWPTVVTLAPSSLAFTSATLNGTVNPNGQATTYHFEWGLTNAYGNSTGIISAGSGSLNVAVSAAISGLTAGTGYHYRLVGVSAGGTAYGEDVVFNALTNPFLVSKPPLDLNVEITTASGDKYLWDSGARKASDRPQGLSFSTKRYEGFSTGACTLGRRIDLDWNDLNLLDSAAFIGADGSVAFEGRLSGEPRTLDQGHHIDPVFTGWIAHTRDRKFVDVFVDQDTSRWADMPLNEQVKWATAGRDLTAVSWGSSGSGLTAAASNLQMTNVLGELWYTPPPGVEVGNIAYQGGQVNWPAQIGVSLLTSSDDSTTVTDSYALTLDNSLRLLTVTAGRHWAVLRASGSAAAFTPAAGALTSFPTLAVYGRTGVPTHWDGVTGDPEGVYASEVFSNLLSRYCPQLSTHPTDFLATSYPIPHVVFDQPTDPYDAFLFLNAFHLWEFGVFENRQMVFGPGDLTDYDWEVRLSDPGVSTTLQGDTIGSDSAESLVNGVAITFTDFNGRVQRLTPDVFTELADPNVENPANKHGIQVWAEPSPLSWPMQQADAISIGQAILAQQNQPKGAGTITVTGHLRNRAGHWQPGHKVRAGQTVAITDFPNDRPRMVVQTDWSHDSKQLTIAVDSTLKTVDAYFDRVASSLRAHGIG